MIKPKRLQKGDTVGIIAPASPTNLADLQRALPFIAALGLNVTFGRHIDREYGYLAGSDIERLADLHDMFLDQDVKAIFCARGGYGTARIASQINYDIIKNNPKIFWGYSDITFLHNAIQKQTGLVTFHGPMVASDIGSVDHVDEVTSSFFQQLFEPKIISYTEQYSPLEVMVEGKVSGEMVGGNLSLIVSSLGTPFEMDTRGKLLLIEDINEEPRSIDRMLNQLYMAGKLQEAAGILLGDFNNCVPNRKQSLTLEEVLEHYVLLANRPTLSGFKIGHCTPHIAIPLGVTATMNTTHKSITIDSGVQ